MVAFQAQKTTIIKSIRDSFSSLGLIGGLRYRSQTCLNFMRLSSAFASTKNNSELPASSNEALVTLKESERLKITCCFVGRNGKNTAPNTTGLLHTFLMTRDSDAAERTAGDSVGGVETCHTCSHEPRTAHNFTRKASHITELISTFETISQKRKGKNVTSPETR